MYEIDYIIKLYSENIINDLVNFYNELEYLRRKKLLLKLTDILYNQTGSPDFLEWIYKLTLLMNTLQSHNTLKWTTINFKTTNE